MSTVLAAPPAPSVPALRAPGVWFATGFVAIAIGAAALSGALPIRFSIATVFLFAGPHNWLEARYALGRLPARAGKLRGFFLISLTGIIGLSAGYAILYWGLSSAGPTEYAVWDTTFIFWIATLIWMRSRTNPKFDGGWVWPAAFLLCAGVWLNPFALNIALVYLHPLMALWLLDRELTRSRPQWRRAYHRVIACIPLLLIVLWAQLRGSPDLPGSDTVSDTLKQAIVNHSGAWYLE